LAHYTAHARKQKKLLNYIEFSRNYAVIVGFFAMLTSRKTVQQGFGQKCDFFPDNGCLQRPGQGETWSRGTY